MLNQFFGLRPRDQNGRRHPQSEMAKVSRSQNVGHGLMARAPPDMLAKSVHLFTRQRSIVLKIEIDAFEIQRVREQEFGV